jgi:hypothetical protein
MQMAIPPSLPPTPPPVAIPQLIRQFVQPQSAPTITPRPVQAGTEGARGQEAHDATKTQDPPSALNARPKSRGSSLDVLV